MLRARISLSETLMRFSYVRSNRNALTFSPVSVVVFRMYPSIVAKERSGLRDAGPQLPVTVRKVPLRLGPLARRHRTTQARPGDTLQIERQVRRALARELHDGPVQLLCGVAMRLDFCRKALETEPALLPGQIEHMKDLVGQIVQQMRTTLFELRPVVLETQGLAAALHEFLKQHQARGSRPRLTLTVDTRHPQGEISRLGATVEWAVFSIVQEAVHNALKHADAHSVGVHLKETPKALYVIVADDGVGFDLDSVRRTYGQRTSLGLINMPERAAQIGAKLKIESAPGYGTRVIVTVPGTD